MYLGKAVLIIALIGATGALETLNDAVEAIGNLPLCAVRLHFLFP
jgi:hypothetical protein